MSGTITGTNIRGDLNEALVNPETQGGDAAYDYLLDWLESIVNTYCVKATDVLNSELEQERQMRKETGNVLQENVDLKAKVKQLSEAFEGVIEHWQKDIAEARAAGRVEMANEAIEAARKVQPEIPPFTHIFFIRQIMRDATIEAIEAIALREGAGAIEALRGGSE